MCVSELLSSPLTPPKRTGAGRRAAAARGGAARAGEAAGEEARGRREAGELRGDPSPNRGPGRNAPRRRQGRGDQGRKFSRAQEGPTDSQAGGQGRPATGRARTKGPASPPPASHNPPSGRGAPPAARPGSARPGDFPEAADGETFSNTLGSRLPAAPRPPLSRGPRSPPPSDPGAPRTRQRPHDRARGRRCGTPVGPNPSPALPHVARQRDGGVGEANYPPNFPPGAPNLGKLKTQDPEISVLFPRSPRHPHPTPACSPRSSGARE